MNVCAPDMMPSTTLPAAAARHRLCALLTCFNRRDMTLACLQSLCDSEGLAGIHLRAVLVDDGSSDGTAEAVRERFPWVTVIWPGADEGALFWCRGMHRAFKVALDIGFDDYLWLNDDTTLASDALSRLIASRACLRETHAHPVLIVGSTIDPSTGRVTYGGERRPSRWKPMRVERIQPGLEPQRCDSMTGNIVLIDADVARRVGNVDPVFEHSMGDTDYALRALAAGISVWVDAGVHGACTDNSPAGTWCDASQSLAHRWRDMMTRKGLPWRSWLALTRRHAGPLWPIHFASPYLKVLAHGLLRLLIQPRRQARP